MSLGHLEPWRRVRRLLVVRADNIGDVVMTGPALRAVKRALPAARLELLASPAGASAAPLLPWIDDVLCRRVLWQDLGRLPFDPARERRLLDDLRARRFDAALILTSFSQSPHPPALAAWLAGIPLRAGASRERGPLLTHAAPHGAFERHQAERNLALVAALGFPVEDDALEIRVPADAAASADVLLAGHGIGPCTPYLLWNPWASAEARTYPPDRGASAVRKAARVGAVNVVITGHARDAEEADRLAERVGPGTVNLVGRTSIPELAALVARACIAVTSHTSVMHLADALRVPVVVPFSGTDLASQWRPRHTRCVLLRRDVPCAPCYEISCPRALECLDIGTDEIANAASMLLGQSQRMEAKRA